MVALLPINTVRSPVAVNGFLSLGCIQVTSYDRQAHHGHTFYAGTLKGPDAGGLRGLQQLDMQLLQLVQATSC
jgi:hypothetical protein